MMQSTFKFQPLCKERPWGGQVIAHLGPQRRLPAGGKIGETWEIADRPGDESVITEGEFHGKTIRWLLDEHGRAVMGCDWPKGKRFPLLVKILDAAERLSLQVHPPPAIARELGGEPKTEMWYLLDAAPEAAFMVGLKRGVSRKEFEKRLSAVVADPAGAAARDLDALIPRVPVRKGEAMFIPAGRLHAIDAGCLILEIQQNSDTTYRVFDWGRVGLDGKPRAIQVKESLRSINFTDFDPSVIRVPTPTGETETGTVRHRLVACEHFEVEHWRMHGGEILDRKTAAVLHVTAGGLAIQSEGRQAVTAQAGETILLAAIPHEVRPMNRSRTELVLGLCPT